MVALICTQWKLAHYYANTLKVYRINNYHCQNFR